MVAHEMGRPKIEADIAKCKKRIARLHDAERQWMSHLESEMDAHEQLQQTREELQRMYSIYYQFIASLLAMNPISSYGG